MTVDQFLAGLNVWARRWSWPMAGCMTFLPNLENRHADERIFG